MADRMTSNGRNIVILKQNSRLRHHAAGAMRQAFLAAALCLGGCSSSLQDITGSIGGASEPDIRRSAEELGRQYDRNPDDKATALSYARALRGMTENAQAVAILQRLASKFPRDVEVLAAYGKALADAGRSREAAEVLAHAHTPERPDWSVLSAQGLVADQLGDHEQAQAYYAAALKIVPAQPHVLSNLGISYALSKKLPQAETRCGKPRHSTTPTNRCARISLSSLPSRANSLPPRRWRGATSTPRTRRPMSPRSGG
jgi:tetratricopeptide (TPR) repeat protein